MFVFYPNPSYMSNATLSLFWSSSGSMNFTRIFVIINERYSDIPGKVMYNGCTADNGQFASGRNVYRNKSWTVGKGQTVEGSWTCLN